MNRLAQVIAEKISQHVRGEISSIQPGIGEYRALFNGPPGELLEQVFDLIVAEGGIDATLKGGQSITVPVVLRVERLPDGVANPLIGVSGLCNDDHLLALRNHPLCPIYVALVGPGYHANLSQSSTRSSFGLSDYNNSGVASVDSWWHDPFIQGLVRGAVDRQSWTGDQDREALHLISKAVRDADLLGKHEVSRAACWNVLLRLWAINDASMPYGSMISLACGFPPFADGRLDAETQSDVLTDLASRIEDGGFGPTFDLLRQRVEDAAIDAALSDLLGQLQQRCDVPAALGRATTQFYGPYATKSLGPAPAWWKVLTVEAWASLLEEGASSRKEAIVIECLNSLVSQQRGFVPVAEGDVCLRIELPEGLPSARVKVTRESGGAKNAREWVLEVVGFAELTDTEPPPHKSPIRYSVVPDTADDEKRVKKGSIRVVSLRQWQPGVLACCRTSSKTSLPKAPKGRSDKVALEQSLSLNGQGRHYIDIYVRAGVSVGNVATAGDEQSGGLSELTSAISAINQSEYGFEVQCIGEGFYDFEVSDQGEAPAVVRLYVSAEEADGEECGSEFERLIRLNRQRDGRATTDVTVNRQLRCTVLQGWMLNDANAAFSHYPLVFAPDYADAWRPPNWHSASETILSAGRFLHDPRPAPDEMEGPPNFMQARRAIAQRIRGKDQDGLVESAKLGEWTATDSEFCSLVEEYVRAYRDWLEASPDVAAWCDVSVVTRLEDDGATLLQEPDALVISPLHPIRLAWHCLAQRSLFLAFKKKPCPAASILDPDCIPDVMTLPTRTASGQVRQHAFISVECSSDYWSILWNASRLGDLARLSSTAPFDSEFGLQIGGVSSGFNMAQVRRAMDDICGMLIAKPVLGVLLSSSAGQNTGCNEGLTSWCRDNLSTSRPDGALLSMGTRLLQVLDERRAGSRPDDADISNLAEDTGNRVRWYSRVEKGLRADLGIIAQLESSGHALEATRVGSALSIGGLVRGRIREQLSAGAGALLTESRMGVEPPPSGDGLADRTAATLARLENLGDQKFGYVFAPSVPTVQGLLGRSEYVAVSSSAIDPACFLGGWLKDAYLWDYDLPSYSTRAGDSNGYYLLSSIKEIDREVLTSTLSKLPTWNKSDDDSVQEVILEVSRRGIPTVRQLSAGNTGAMGSLGLLIATRLLQDEFRPQCATSLFPIWTRDADVTRVVLVLPVDPFREHIEDLSRALKLGSFQRPDLLIVSISVSDTAVKLRLTPVEVKYRGGKESMLPSACQSALRQSTALSDVLRTLSTISAEPEMVMWKITFQHLLVSMLDFGFRVYSQQLVGRPDARHWTEGHARVVGSIYAGEANVEIDDIGRLIVIDGSMQSAARDFDSDGFHESIVLSHKDAALIASGAGNSVYEDIRLKVRDWRLAPIGQGEQFLKREPQPSPTPILPPAPVPQSPPLKPGAGPHREPQMPTPQPSPPTPSNPVHLGEPRLDAGVSLIAGKPLDGFEEKIYTLDLGDTRLNQLNIGIVGDLGTGKTQLTKALIWQLAKSTDNNKGVSPRVLIFDYKNDYSSPEFVNAVGAKVLKPQRLPVNIFDVRGAGSAVQPWLDRFKFFSDVLDKIYSGIGPVQRSNLRRAVRLSYDQAEIQRRQPNIYDVHANYQDVTGGRADSVSSILDDIVDLELFSPSADEAGAFEQMLDGVVVVSLNELGQDDRTKNMLVAFMLNFFYEHMLRTPKRPYFGAGGRFRVVDSYLLVDEADNIMRYEFDVLRKILLQGREFGFGVILASQYLRHFKAGATDYREPLLSWFIHKVPNITAQELGALGLTGDVSQFTDRVKSLGLHECMFKSFNAPGTFIRGLPFFEAVA